MIFCNLRSCSSDWLERVTDNDEVPGSSPGSCTNMSEIRSYNDESIEAREDAVEKLKRFLEKIDFVRLGQDEKIEAIKRLTPDQLKKLLVAINSQVNNLDRFSPKKFKEFQSTKVSMLGGVEFEPPKNAKKLVSDLIEKFLEDFSVKSFREWVAVIYIAINFAHIFPNGNGRTSRVISTMLLHNSHEQTVNKILKRELYRCLMKQLLIYLKNGILHIRLKMGHLLRH